MSSKRKIRIGDWIKIPKNFELEQYRERWAKVTYISGELLEIEVSPGKLVDCTVDDIGQKRTLAPKARYEIMKRDGFRCQVCGRSSQDNVVLEIDHKTPYSRGGMTSPDNLHTLCRDCNRGKGADDLHIADNAQE